MQCNSKRTKISPRSSVHNSLFKLLFNWIFWHITSYPTVILKSLASKRLRCFSTSPELCFYSSTLTENPTVGTYTWSVLWSADASQL